MMKLFKTHLKMKLNELLEGCKSSHHPAANDAAGCKYNQSISYLRVNFSFGVECTKWPLSKSVLKNLYTYFSPFGLYMSQCNIFV